MNFQIARIRLAAVGPEPARYDPLRLDLEHPDGSGPTDTVLYLPNTGGKTVLMRLLFSVLHPPIVERIGTEETALRKKNLLGYVLERDTAHVAIEWRRVDAGRYADDEALVVGLVAEWRGGRPTGKPEDLVRLWYSLRGPAELVGVDQLTFDALLPSEAGPVRRRLPLARFREQLEELRTRKGRPRVGVTTTSIQRDWIEHLDQLGLDRALFRYQGEMNHNEAGASAIARFRCDMDFIKFFLDAVLDPAELAALDREFDEVADKVRRFPEYERRLEFERAALAELEPLGGLVARLAVAREEAQAAKDDALRLLAAFTGAEALVREREQRAREVVAAKAAEARQLTADADRQRDEWRELRRLGAELWQKEAELTHEAAARREAILEHDVRAWTLTDELARHDDAAARVSALDAAYAAEVERLRPLQTARDEAAERLARHLRAEAVVAERQAAEARDRRQQAKQRASATRKEEREAHVEAAKLDERVEGAERQLARVIALREGLVARGLLSAEEDAEQAHAREAARAKQAIERLEAIERESAALEGERAELDAADRAAAPRREEVGARFARLSSEVERAEAERKALSEDALVVEANEGAVADLELVGVAIAERLLGRAREADAARLELELQGVSDQRAVRSLEETGLLPPPAEVDAALERLAAAGITKALPGTRYVAQAIARGARQAVVANRADLVGGIILTDPADMARARAVLEAAALDPAMIIAVGPAAALFAAEDAPMPADVFVVPPAEALWDQGAAGEERARREARLAALDAQRSDLDERASGARRLAEALVRHASSCPPGWLSMRRAERDGLAGELNRLDVERRQRDARRAEIASSLKELRAESIDLRKAVVDAEKRAGELEHLRVEEAAVAGLAAQVERERAEASNWRTLAEEAGRRASAADGEADREASAAQDHRAAAERALQEVSSIGLRDPIQAPSDEEALALLQAEPGLLELRARFNALEQRLAGETSASAVAAERREAIRSRDAIAAALETHPVAVRERAAALLRTPEAASLAGRRAAAERAREEAQGARAATGDAHLELEKAAAELRAVKEEIRSSRRAAKIPEDRLPRDRHHAAVLAATARREADRIQSGVALAERARDQAATAAEASRKLADNLDMLTKHLRLGLKLAEDAELPAASPFEGGVEEASSIGLEAGQRLTRAIDAERDAEQAWRERDSAVREVLAREEFSELAASDSLYRRLARSPAEVLARDVHELVTELRACIGILEGELASLEEDRKLATTSLVKNVQKALNYLRLAEKRSKLPDQLRGWSGERFLEIGFKKPPSEELDVRLRTFVVEVLDPSDERPTGTKLLMHALQRAVGEFKVQVLKPNEAFRPLRVPVAELSSPSFSNGQRATVATALMLMMSELRRQSRSAARAASVGTLLLDNPLGSANAGFLIDVQRTVASAAGIQLVYTTGIADMSALRRFSNVIALSNDSARRTMRRYVRANPELLQLLVPQDEELGGRLSAQRVVVRRDDGNGA